MEKERSLMEYLGPLEKDELDSMRLTSEDDRNQRFLLSGAAPLLVGILAGNTGDAAEIAGKALLREDQRQLKEDSDLMGYIRKKRAAKSSSVPKMQKISFMDDRGIKKGGYFNPSTGKYYDTNNNEISNPTTYTPFSEEVKTIARNRGKLQSDPSWGKSLTTDDLGRKGYADSSTQTFAPLSGYGQNGGKLAPVEEKKVAAATKEYSKIAGPLEESLSSSNKALSLLALNDNSADRAAVTMFAKQLEPGGRLSDFDVRRLEGGQGAWDYVKKMFTKINNGQKLTDAQRASVVRTISEVENLTRAELKKKRSRFIREAKKYDMKGIGDYIPSMLDKDQRIIKVDDGENIIEINIEDLPQAINSGARVI